MAVLDRSELEASPLADLHAIADQIGLEGFRRLRKADLIDTILGEPGRDDDSSSPAEQDDGAESSPPARKRRAPRLRRGRAAAGEERSGGDDDEDQKDGGSEDAAESESEQAPQSSRRSRGRSGNGAGRSSRAGESRTSADGESRSGGDGETRSSRGGGRSARGGEDRPARPRGGSDRGRAGADRDGDSDGGQGRLAEGVVEVLANGSAFLRVEGPEPSDEDVYISAAQVRRCELVSGDRVTGPVRTPRRSERYPSLVRIDTINGASADSVSDGARYEELPVEWPGERLALESKDPTLEAIEWLTPLGKGSRATIVGARHAGKSEILRRLAATLAGRDGLELSVVLAGARPEEIADWMQSTPEPVAALSFAASSDSQGQAVERALDAAKRIATRGGDAVVLIDGLDGLHPPLARRALAAARNLREGGSLTVVATSSRPVGGETTVIALDAALTASGREPILDLAASSTLQAERLVGADGAAAIAKARAKALDSR